MPSCPPAIVPVVSGVVRGVRVVAGVGVGARGLQVRLKLVMSVGGRRLGDGGAFSLAGGCEGAGRIHDMTDDQLQDGRLSSRIDSSPLF